MDRSLFLRSRSPQAYELVRLVVHVAGCLYAEIDGFLGIPFVLEHMISVLW